MVYDRHCSIEYYLKEVMTDIIIPLITVFAPLVYKEYVRRAEAKKQV